MNEGKRQSLFAKSEGVCEKREYSKTVGHDDDSLKENASSNYNRQLKKIIIQKWSTSPAIL